MAVLVVSYNTTNIVYFGHGTSFLRSLQDVGLLDTTGLDWDNNPGGMFSWTTRNVSTP